MHWGCADADDDWRRTITLSATFADQLDKLSDSERERVRKTVAERAAARLASDDHGLDGIALVATAE